MYLRSRYDYVYTVYEKPCPILKKCNMLKKLKQEKWKTK